MNSITATAQAPSSIPVQDAWDLVTLLEIHNLLMDTHLKETTNIDRAKFANYFKTVDYLVKRDGNAAVYYKAAAELKSWGGKYQEAKELFEEAIPLLRAETPASWRHGQA
eukprot:s104_g27.t1